jgi:thiol:disulfide interchange protein
MHHSEMKWSSTFLIESQQTIINSTPIHNVKNEENHKSMRSIRIIRHTLRISTITCAYVLLTFNVWAIGSSNIGNVTGINAEPVIETQLHAQSGNVTPQSTIPLAWEFKLSPGWHIYWSNPGDSGLPPELLIGGTSISLTFPAPHVIEMPPIINYGYENQVILHGQIHAPHKVGQHNLNFEAHFLYCKDVCLPGKVSLTLPLQVTPNANNAENPAYQMPVTTPSLTNVKVAFTNQRGSIFLPSNIDWKNPRFIPNSDGIIDDSAPQNWHNNQLTIMKDSQGEPLPSILEGLILDGKLAYTITVPIEKGQASAQLYSVPIPSISLSFALLSAFIAGFILNLMPCVLPVLSLKILGFIRHHQSSQRIQHTLAYSAGVMASFWFFAILISIFQSSGHDLGWGFHLQSPMFVAFLALIMVGISLNFFSVFEIGQNMSRLGTHNTSKSLQSSATTGMLAVVVATPCTVPFMGTAMAYALTQPVYTTLAIFTAMGLGMSAPFLLLAINQQWTKILPKPGAWMNTFRHAMGWPMLLTALWLAYIFNSLTNQISTFGLFTIAIILALGLWMYGHTSGLYKRFSIFIVGACITTVILLLPKLYQPTTSTTLWQPWSKEAVNNSLQKNVPVFIDFTADWCITCKVTEATVLNTTRANELFATTGTHLYRADWTRYNPEITAELAKHGRKGVPLYLLYLPGANEPEILPQLLTIGILEKKWESTRR